MKKKLNVLGRIKRPKLHDGIIVIRVSKNLKRRFSKYCKQRGDTPAALLRKYIMKSTRSGGF